jgi:hypothetical protein
MTPYVVTTPRNRSPRSRLRGGLGIGGDVL